MKKFALGIDVLFLLLFVGVGRSAHEHGITLTGMTSTTWPFAVGLLGGWLTVARARRTPTTPTSGIVIVLVTVALGMVLRVVSGQGTAFAFVVVALMFLSLFLVGWRTVAAALVSRRG